MGRRAAGASGGARVIVDVHSHIMWYPDHVGEQWAKEALASKLVKLKFSGGLAHAAALDLHSYDSTPETHWEAAQQTDKTIVFGLQAKATGIWVPNELIADYAKQHPDKIVGWASIDPNEPEAIDQLDHAVNVLGLRGLKLGPAYQHFDPTDRKHWPFFEAVQRHGIPIIWHQGTTFPSRAKLRWSTAALARGHRAGLPRHPDDRRPPRPSVGRGPGRADPQGAEHVRRHQRRALPAVALLAGDGHRDGIRRDPQAAARVGLPVRDDQQRDRRAPRASTTSWRGRSSRRSRPKSRTGSSTRTGKKPCRSCCSATLNEVNGWNSPRSEAELRDAIRPRIPEPESRVPELL